MLLRVAVDILRFMVIMLGALTIHEFGHATAAVWLGDSGPADAGRVSLNPLRHLHPLGSVALPLAALLLSRGTLLIAFARPVMIDLNKFERPRAALALIGFAGPAANLLSGLVAAVAGAVLPYVPAMSDMFYVFALVSLALAILNLIPLPPLDGSRVFQLLLGDDAAVTYLVHGVWGLALVIAVWLVGLVFFEFDMIHFMLDATAKPVVLWLTNSVSEFMYGLR